MGSPSIFPTRIHLYSHLKQPLRPHQRTWSRLGSLGSGSLRGWERRDLGACLGFPGPGWKAAPPSLHLPSHRASSKPNPGPGASQLVFNSFLNGLPGPVSLNENPCFMCDTFSPLYPTG